MRRVAICGVVLGLVAGTVAARSLHRPIDVLELELDGRPIGGAQPAAAVPAHATAARIAAIGEGGVVIDADSGALVRIDPLGAPLARLAIGADAGLLSYDPVARRAYVADRRGDRVVVVEVGAHTLAVARTFATPREPYAVALSPDRGTLLVAAIADRALVAYDPATGGERWRTALDREPRGLAISADGARAVVSYLGSGAIDVVDLRETRRARSVALAMSPDAGGPAFARAAFAVTFLGAHQAVVGFQRAVPSSEQIAIPGSYGGGAEAPVIHQLAFVGLGGPASAVASGAQASAEISAHQPRALAWDGARDALYVAGLGNDRVQQLVRASQVGISPGTTAALYSDGRRCGPDGLAVTARGDVLVWCAFRREVARVMQTDARGVLLAHGAGPLEASVAAGPEVAASRLTPSQHAGMVLFHAADHRLSGRGALACASCHPDQRSDGLSWALRGHALQTPVLAGRVRDTAPFKWDGGDPDLATSVARTVTRLGGRGAEPAMVADLVAYLEQLPPVRAPSREPAAVARGAQVFDAAGCRSCHDGAAYTDQDRHKLAGSLAQSDTPSLRGAAASAPYFHDGSAATLEAVVRGRAAVHGMSAVALTDAEAADLTAFLETL